MIRTMKALGIMFAAMTIAIPVYAQFQKDDQAETLQEKMEGQQQAETQQISGTVIREKTVEVEGKDSDHQVVLLQTPDGNQIIADLGPVENLEEMALQHGKQLMLQGNVARVSDRPVILASQVSADGRTVEIERPELAQKKAAVVQPQQMDFSKSMEVTGEVVAEKSVEVEDMAGDNKVVLLKLETGDNVVADLGPEEALGMDLGSGEQVAVTGNLARVGDQLVLMADQVSVNGKTADVERFVP